MTEDRSYKLAQYRIIETSHGTLRWESHGGMAGLKEGRCFIKGNVLIIGPSEVIKSGFLKREFLEKQNKLPQWDKTAYYCPSHALYVCKTGTSISFDNEKVGSRFEPLHPAGNHIPCKSQGRREIVHRQSNRIEVISDIKMKIGKAGHLLRFLYGMIRRR